MSEKCSQGSPTPPTSVAGDVSIVEKPGDHMSSGAKWSNNCPNNRHQQGHYNKNANKLVG